MVRVCCILVVSVLFDLLCALLFCVVFLCLVVCCYVFGCCYDLVLFWVICLLLVILCWVGFVGGLACGCGFRLAWLCCW